MTAVKLDAMSRKELEELRSQLDSAAKRAEDRERKQALEAARKAAADYGFSLDELIKDGSASGRPRKRGASAARYRNPENASQTWTGKGRKPNWFIAQLERGVDPASMEI